MNERTDIIIARKLSGEATAEELQKLELWLAADPGNRELYHRVAAVWQDSAPLFSASGFDTAAAWNKVSGRTGITAPARRKVPIWTYVSAAAAVIAILLLVLRPGTDTQLQTITAAAGNQELELPDHSHITLRKGSSISYPASFAGNERRVTLKGEAFFDVARDESKPFIISAEQVNVKVLGTSFTVKCDASSAKVTVSTGKVQMISASDTAAYLVLTPGEQGSMQDQQLTESVVTDDNHLFWKTGKLQFSNKSLRSILADLGHYYRSNIILTPGTPAAIQEQLITISFSNQKIEAVLNELCQVARCSWQQKGQQYVIAEIK